MRKLNDYIVYYEIKNEPFEYEIKGVHQLKEMIKWLHNVKASSITIFKRKADANNKNNQVKCYQQFWK